ncbi:methyl-accepting chemotaxis protein [Deltaproteobacteria bacterium TL4]
MWNKLNIGNRLAFGFGFMMVLFLLTNLFVISRMNYLAEFTENLYNHPLTVSNAVLRIGRDITKMHDAMGDLLLATNKNDLQIAVDLVNSFEKQVYADFDIIEERFLGKKEMWEQAKEIFTAWRPLRENEIQLIQQGKREEVAAIVKGKASEHVLLLESKVNALNQFAQDKATEFINNAMATTEITTTWVFIIVICSLVLFSAVGYLITKSVTGPIRNAVSNLQNVGTELEAVARQQATTATEQTTSVSEVSSTAQELVATAKQIASNTERVSIAAQKTSENGQNGSRAVNDAKAGMEKTKKQVQLIAQHMSDLGSKSQRIGVVLEIINELSEQTNLLSLNATIEAAGAGEAGQRFAVVADEVRKLAERSFESTKEIKELITDIQQTANTTIMVTEDGTKAVDEGVKLFSEVTGSIQSIMNQANSTSSASKEIELTTRQQTTSVEQVSTALNDLSITAKQTEQNAGQILETIKILVNASNDLERMI